MQADERTCPECAETIKKAAAVCRYCGHRFRSAETWDGPRNAKEERVARKSQIGCAVAVVGLVLLIAFCSPDSDVSEQDGSSVAVSEEEADVSLDRSAQHNVVIMSRDGVRERLRDPDSAEFRNVGYYSGGEAMGVCGEVNAKNAFGGFTGYERFIAAGENVAFLESDMDAAEFQKAWSGICVKADSDEVQLP